MLIIANWKAYVVDTKKAKTLVTTAKRLARSTEHTIVLAPPAPFLGLIADGGESVAFAAQDISATTGGAETGESLAQTVVAAGATYVLVGHSERRAHGDTNTIVAEKLSHALAQGLIPVLCIGERERDSDGRYLAFIREQLVSAFSPLSPKERRQVIIAYEPIWAINKTAGSAISITDLAELVLYIQKVLAELLPDRSARELPILYGGSVEASNAPLLAVDSGIAGFLIGHASVDPDSFSAIVRAV